MSRIPNDSVQEWILPDIHTCQELEVEIYGAEGATGKGVKRFYENRLAVSVDGRPFSDPAIHRYKSIRWSKEDRSLKYHPSYAVSRALGGNFQQFNQLSDQIITKASKAMAKDRGCMADSAVESKHHKFVYTLA
jgi:hypothetical protein